MNTPCYDSNRTACPTTSSPEKNVHLRRWSNAVSTATLRTQLATNLLNWCDANGFDGCATGCPAGLQALRAVGGAVAAPARSQGCTDHPAPSSPPFFRIDIDWEYPGNTARGGTGNDKANLGLFFAEYRKLANARKASSGKTYLLSMAMAATSANLVGAWRRAGSGRRGAAGSWAGGWL